MSLKKVMLFYGVFSYTCSDSSSARSLYELQKVICILLKKTPNQLDTVFTQNNMDWANA